MLACCIPRQTSRWTELTIVDAYCGVGTFARILAQHVGKVIAIEESASAIKDAQWNLRDVNNVEILKGKVEDMLPNLATRIDGLVIDPPRAGCQQVVLDALVQNPVTRIVYVSCDPSTLARDLNILCHLHPIYQLRSVQPLDMFPQTAHIECVATSGACIVTTNPLPLLLASASPRRRQIISLLGLPFTVGISPIDEDALQETYQGPVEKLGQWTAEQKALAIHTLPEAANRIVITADTTVVLDDEELGKPHDEEHARKLLLSLRDRWHHVITGVVVSTTIDGELRMLGASCDTPVLMRDL